MATPIVPGISKSQAAEKVASMLVEQYPGKFVRAQEQGTTEAPKHESRQAPEPAQPELEPEPTGVPDSPPEQDVADSSPEAAERPEATSDKEHNFVQLRQQLAEERTRRESIERELRIERQRKSKEKRSEVLEAVLSDGAKPEDFDSWSKERQNQWQSGLSAMAQIRENLGESGVAEMKRVILENQILTQIPGLSADQLDTVSQILVSASTLTPKEALMIAQGREPALFPQTSMQSAGPVMPVDQRVQEPSRSGRRRAPEPKDKQLLEAVFQARSPLARKRAAAQYVRERVIVH